MTGQRYRQGLPCASSLRNSTFDSRFSAVTTTLATPKLLVALPCADGNINPGKLTTRTDVLLLCTATSPCYCRRHKILRSLARSVVQTPMMSRTAKSSRSRAWPSSILWSVAQNSIPNLQRNLFAPSCFAQQRSNRP